MHMQSHTSELPAVAHFGRRKVAPRACIADSKEHICKFLRDALEELGFIASDCAPDDDVPRLLAERLPDLFVLGLSAGGIAASLTLEALAASAFDGKVLVFGQRSSPMVAAILALGEELGLSMLPLLPTPFRDSDLRERVALLLPMEAPPSPPVHVAEALHAGWLELWYQPKIDIRSLTLNGAEALVRMRHPTWGIVPPACFIPDADDPHFGVLSDFVVAQAGHDWRYFFEEYGPLSLSINLPLGYFRDPAAIENLSRHLPKHPAFDGLIVEINAPELVQNLPLATKVARALQLHNIGTSIDNVGAEWPLLLMLQEFPFVEIKVDRAFVTGCADDRLKQSTCRRIIELADRTGARTVAEGVETRTDFLTARELGFDTVQGFFFAKPMEPHKFARRVLGKPVIIQE
jgi:EAL domain-containing protein (putative c-di-GMP-specific phosphodiesterase class I)